MKLPLFRLIHDIINENGDKSFANHGMLWHRNRPLFSVMNVTAITIHEMEKQKANMNASILLIRYIIHSRITGANLLYLVRFSLSLLITATRASIFQVISKYGYRLRVFTLIATPNQIEEKKEKKITRVDWF